MYIVTGLMDVLGVPSQTSENRHGTKNRRRKSKYEEDFCDDEEETLEEQNQRNNKRDMKTKRTRGRRQNEDKKVNTGKILDTLIGSCSDLKEFYTEQYGRIKDCEVKECQTAPCRNDLRRTTQRHPSRPRARSTSRLKGENYGDRTPRDTIYHYGERVASFGLGIGAEIPVPVCFHNDMGHDEMSAVTGVTLEEMARARRQANQKSVRVKQNFDCNKLHGDDDTAVSSEIFPPTLTDASAVFPPSPTGTSTSSNTRDPEEYDQYDTSALPSQKIPEQDNTNFIGGKSIFNAACPTTPDFESMWQTNPKPQGGKSSLPKEWEQKNSSIKNLETETSSKYRLPPPRGWSPRHTKLTI